MKNCFFVLRAGYFCLLLLSSYGALFAQSRIQGKVTDETSGNALPGVTIAIKGSNRGTATDANGAFSLPAGKGDVLVLSFVGYAAKEVTVGSETNLHIVLKETVGSLEEVVVTGYSSQKKKDLTGAVAVINVDQLTRQPTAQVNDQLQGQASGVTVISAGQPGEAPVVRIRGLNTFGNNTPLYVVDGVPTQNINDLNPNDVATMQVLKDAGAASIYGSRASNGVIVITTKRGTGKVKVRYDAYYGSQRVKGGNVWDILGSQEMANLKWMALKNSNPNASIKDDQYGNGPEPVLPDYIAPAGIKEGDPAADPAKYKVDPNYTTSSALDNFYRIVKANKSGTDWFHEIFKPAPITSHNISVGGGGDQGNYFFSFNYFNQQGTLTNTYMRRYTLRANSLYNVSKNVRIGENLEYSIINNPQIGDLAEGSAIGMAFREQPIIPVHDINGNFAGSFGPGLGNARNPVAIQDRTRNNKTLANRLFGNMYVEVDFLKHFTARSSFGGEFYSFNNHQFTFPEYENSENTTTNSYTENAGNGYNWTWTSTLTYHQNFNQMHDVKVMVGTEAYDNRGRNVGGTTQSYFSFDPDYTNLTTGDGTQTNYSNSFSDGLFSLLARLDYSFHDKYLLGATIRRDGSSRFLNYQYGWFPAVSVGWRVSQEPFMKGIGWISDLKIRGGYGIMGNQMNVDPGNAYTTFNFDKGSSYYDISGSGSRINLGFRQGHIGNPDAKWESNVNSNIGLDATLFKGNLEFTFDYYRKDVRDLLYTPELPGAAGQPSPPTVNIAKMKNEGIDMALTGYVDIGKDLKLNATLTFTTYKNEIVQVSGDAAYFDQEARRFNGSNIIRNAVGQPVSSFFGYNIMGFWDDAAEIQAANEEAQKATSNPNAIYQTDAKTGRFRYQDINGDGRITPDDRTFLGSPNPDFTYGFNIGLNYKNFDFSIFLYGVAGNETWNQVKWWTDFYSSFQGSKSKTALYDSWRPDHKNAKVSIQENDGSFSTNTVPNSYFVEKGSYLRARNVQIGYTFPTKLINRAGISSFRIYAQAANLFTITKYSGIDPEIGGGTTNFGIDEGLYPAQRQYLVGVNVSF